MAKMKFVTRAFTKQGTVVQPLPSHTGVYLSSLAIYPARFQEDQWSLGRNTVNQRSFANIIGAQRSHCSLSSNQFTSVNIPSKKNNQVWLCCKHQEDCKETNYD
jgi:hypothetical protein